MDDFGRFSPVPETGRRFSRMDRSPTYVHQTSSEAALLPLTAWCIITPLPQTGHHELMERKVVSPIPTGQAPACPCRGSIACLCKH
eukprot:6194316-Pleurochrysis_carterae.AAC.1